MKAAFALFFLFLYTLLLKHDCSRISNIALPAHFYHLYHAFNRSCRPSPSPLSTCTLPLIPLIVTNTLELLPP
ncbi:hypothetical protein EDC01DRAFT_676734 [Geopyxis carbonaria]|nr:hypothetical protein EDC01DRAFT_676734 [Geopyxis carbonaria]